MFVGPNLQGYDIGCAFRGTMEKALFYQMTGVENRCGHTLPALHGYGHNRHCQLGHQVLYCEGAGLSDFEQCERFFSACNLVATLTRHSTAFHRHQFLDIHFRHWNKEKISNLGRFILDHYKSALRIIGAETPKLAHAAITKQFNAATYRKWTKEEELYLASLKKEPPEDTLKCLYVEQLQKLWKLQ